MIAIFRLITALALVAALLATPSGFAERSTYAPAPAWIVRVDPGGLDLGEGAAMDALGNAYVTGIAESDGQQDIVTAKLSPTGVVVWTRTIDKGPADRGEDVAAGPDGGAIVVGSIGANGGDDVLVAKYSSQGDLLWTTTFDKGTSEVARGVAIAGNGDILIAGTSLSNAGADGFVARLSSEGDELWSHPINLFFFEEVFDVTTTPNGNVVVAGRVLRDTDFDVLVRAFSPEGRVQWTQYLATPAREEGRGVEALPDNGVVVVGTQEVGQGDASQDDILVARFAADGGLVWSKTFDLGGGDDAGRDVAVDAAGQLLVTGFGPRDGSKDPAILKLTEAGTEIWRAVEPIDGTAGTGAVAIGPGGRIVLVGATEAADGDFSYLIVSYEERTPSAAFRASPGAASRTILFEDASAPGDAPLVGWRWEFGDGAISTESNPVHVYEWGGTYVAKLAVTDAAGNRAITSKTLSVEGPPRPAPTPVLPGATQEDPTPSSTPPSAPTPTPEDEREKTPGPALALVVALVALAAWSLRRRAR